MKQVIMVLWCMIPVWGWGQTVEIETAYLNKQVSEKKWTQDEAIARSKKWAQIRVNYPVLPYDTATHKMKIEDVITFPGISKAQAYKRVKEWAALSFGHLQSVLEYEDPESGKIILEGFSGITYLTNYPWLWGRNKTAPTSSNLYFSLVVTIKDGKAKVKYENMEFRYWRAGYALSTFYVPGEWEKTEFDFYLPVTSRDPEGWESTIDLLRQSVIELKATAPSLEKYIRAVNDDYGF